MTEQDTNTELRKIGLALMDPSNAACGNGEVHNAILKAAIPIQGFIEAKGAFPAGQPAS